MLCNHFYICIMMLYRICYMLHHLQGMMSRLPVLCCHLVNGANFLSLALNTCENATQCFPHILDKPGFLHCFLLGMVHRSCCSGNIVAEVPHHTRNQVSMIFGLFGQFANTRRHWSKTTAMLASECSLNGRVQRQSIGLISDSRNHLDNVIDLRRAFTQRLHFSGCHLHILLDMSYFIDSTPYSLLYLSGTILRLISDRMQLLRMMCSFIADMCHLLNTRSSLNNLLNLLMPRFYRLCHLLKKLHCRKFYFMRRVLDTHN